MDYLKDKTVLVTGVCGTIGSELIRTLLNYSDRGPSQVVGLDNNETGLFYLDQQYRADDRVRFALGDVRDVGSLGRELCGVDVVFHTAALKHVGLCESAPAEAIQTNIHGVQNLIRAACDNDVEKVVLTSSDKAVNPTNVMGTSKLMGERLMTAADSERRRRGCRTVFTSTRFGNVLGSNGSVMPVFTKQIAGGGPLTLTDVQMTRFVMSVREAVKLVIDSAALAVGGEIFVTKMPVIRIEDLAAVMIAELSGHYGWSDVKTLLIGAKPGEKFYEELMTEEETSRVIELDRYFVIRPALSVTEEPAAYPGVVARGADKPYVSSSEPVLSRDELTTFLYRHRLFDGLLPGGDGDRHGAAESPPSRLEQRRKVRLLVG